VAARQDAALERGLAGPGLLAYIVTSKFADYLPLYRLEDIFARQGFEIARATQAVWCGDVADLVEPLYRRMVERVRQSHVVATDDTVLPCSARARPSRRGCGCTWATPRIPTMSSTSPGAAPATDRKSF